MAIYEAKILDDAGAQLLTISAIDLESARETAERAGRLLYCRKRLNILGTRYLSSAEREQFLGQLGFLTSSGMGTGEALRTMQINYSGRPAQVASELLAHIQAGQGLDAAMESVGTGDFPAASLALVRAGYRAGQSSDALEAAAEFEVELRKLKESSGTGLVSAFIGFVGAAVMIVGSVYFIGPSVLSSSVIAGAGDAVDVGWASALGNVTAGFIVLVCLGLSFLFASHLGLRRIRPLVADKIALAVPLWRDIALAQERYLAFFAVQALVAPAISLEQVFEIASKGTPAGALRNELERAGQAVRDGEPWLPQLDTLGPIDKAALGGASDRGQLAIVFKRLALQYRDRYGRSRETAALALKLVSALCLTIAGAVLFALSVLPMLQASASIT